VLRLPETGDAQAVGLRRAGPGLAWHGEEAESDSAFTASRQGEEAGRSLWRRCLMGFLSKGSWCFLVNKSRKKSGGQQAFSLGERVRIRTTVQAGRPRCWCLVAALLFDEWEREQGPDKRCQMSSQNMPSFSCYFLSCLLCSSFLLFSDDGLYFLASGAFLLHLCPSH